MTEEYYECPVCEYNDKRDLYETKKELAEHISEGHTQNELAEYIIGDVIRFEYNPEELGKRKIVKSSVRKSPLQLSEKIRKINSVELEDESEGMTYLDPKKLWSVDETFELPAPEDPITVEGIRRIVRDEILKVVYREHLQK